MKKKSKRICMAVIGMEVHHTDTNLPVDVARLCGREPYDKPDSLYVPLCAAHRTMASVSKIKVFADGMLADYRL